VVLSVAGDAEDGLLLCSLLHATLLDARSVRVKLEDLFLLHRPALSALGSVVVVICEATLLVSSKEQFNY